MDRQQRKSVRKIIKQDKRMLRLREAFQNFPQYSMPFEDLAAELKLLHSQRQVSKLSINSPNFVKHLGSATTNDHAFRSRITEILVQCSGVRSNLTRTLEAIETYILNEYADYMKSLRTKEERKSFVSSLLEPYYDYLENVNVLVEQCKYYIDCIDKGGFMVRDMVQAYSVVYKYEPS